MTLNDLIEQVATALEPIADEITDLNIYPHWSDTPTPPALDVYPGTPFQTFAAFGTNNQVFLTVRARVGMGDTLAAQLTLLRLLDPHDPASVEAALADIDVTVTEGGASGFTVYADDAPANERMLGCEWRVQTFIE